MIDDPNPMTLRDFHAWLGKLLNSVIDPDAVIMFRSDGRDIGMVPLLAYADLDGGPDASAEYVRIEDGISDAESFPGAVSALCFTLTV